MAVGCSSLPRSKGLYILEIIVQREARVGRGLLSGVAVPPGLYAYVGSAGGPGGLKGRICRHARLAARGGRPKWHVDWLLVRGRVVGVYFLEGCWGRRAEEELSLLLSKVLDEAVPRFGSTDTSSRTHLYVVRGPPGSVLPVLRRARSDWRYTPG